jgi:phosphatidylserine/phosphatidylglycerophosphate/cardiolipin synthase-like enzyme
VVTERPSSPTHEILAALVAAAGPGALQAVAAALRSGDVSLDSSSVGIARLRGVDDRNAELFARAFAAVDEFADASGIALALETAHRVTVRDAERAPQVEVVWTGPDAGGPLVRPTAAVLGEMLRNTRSGGEILLVGYSLTADDGSQMMEIIELLGEASRNQAQISVVLHKDEEAKNRENLLAVWNVFAVKPTIYMWEPEAAGPYSKMHAKVLVVDRVEVLVTSANFTYHGLHENIEVGLRVRGPQAAAIAQRFDHLISEHVLKLWD